MRQREALAGTRLLHEGHLTKVRSLVSLAIQSLLSLSYDINRRPFLAKKPLKNHHEKPITKTLTTNAKHPVIPSAATANTIRPCHESRAKS
jgi:hypothetical protein